MSYLFLVFNLLFLLFWIRLWSRPEKEFFFNPFLSGTIRLTETVLAFLRPVLYLPEQATAFVVLLFITLFKTLLFVRLNLEWSITLGTYFQFSPAAPVTLSPSLLSFSVLHVAVFLLRLWTVYLLVRLITPPFRTTRASEALAFFARPLSRLPFLAQPVVLFGLHVLLAFALSRISALHVVQLPSAQKIAAASPFVAGPLIVQALKTLWLAALSFADGLALLIRMLFAFIIGNLGAALLQSRGGVLICSEGVELLLGRFARRGGTGMGFDFTPLIFFFVVDLLYNSICRGLYELIQLPFFNSWTL